MVSGKEKVQGLVHVSGSFTVTVHRTVFGATRWNRSTKR